MISPTTKTSQTVSQKTKHPADFSHQWRGASQNKPSEEGVRLSRTCNLNLTTWTGETKTRQPSCRLTGFLFLSVPQLDINFSKRPRQASLKSTWRGLFPNYLSSRHTHADPMKQPVYHSDLNWIMHKECQKWNWRNPWYFKNYQSRRCFSLKKYQHYAKNPPAFVQTDGD